VDSILKNSQSYNKEGKNGDPKDEKKAQEIEPEMPAE
jgi:hypothetical protein